MGAKYSSRNSKSTSYSITVLGNDDLGRLHMLDSMRFRPGQAAKQLPRFAYFVNESTITSSWWYSGRHPNKALVHRILENTDGAVYVVDSSNEDTLQNDLSTLDKNVLKDEVTQNMVMMILVNKHDEEGALSLKQIENKVGEILASHDPKLGGRTLLLRGCNSLTREGLEEAFSHFAQIIQLNKQGQTTPGLQTFTGDELQALGKKDNNSLLHSLKKMFEKSYIKSVLLY